MNETMRLVLAFMTGFLLGTFFFGGLWWTVRRGVRSRQPGFWFVFSMLVRTGIVLAGFYFIAGDGWQRLLLCLSGFVAARLVVMRFNRSIHGTICRTTEATHAS